MNIEVSVDLDSLYFDQEWGDRLSDAIREELVRECGAAVRTLVKSAVADDPKVKALAIRVQMARLQAELDGVGGG